MKTKLLCLLCLMAGYAFAQQAWPPPGPLVSQPPAPPPPAATTPVVLATTNAPTAGTNAIVGATLRNMNLLPMGWLNNAKGYEKALALQQETGADIFIVFTRNSPANEKGLYSWLQSKTLNDPKMRKWLKNYIRVEAVLPSNPDTTRLGEEYKVLKTPAVFVKQTTGFSQMIKVFNFKPNERPEPIPVEEVLTAIQTRSSAPYQSIPLP